MNFVLSCCALVVCCLFCFDLTLCKPQKSLSEGNSYMYENLHYFATSSDTATLFLGIAAASSGKTIFKTPHTLSEDCIRISRVIMQSYEKLSTKAKTVNYLKASIAEVLKHSRNSTIDDLVSMLCDKLSKPVQESSSNIPDFDEQKKAVQVPKPAKNFILDGPSNQNSIEWKSSIPLNDPEVVKLPILWGIDNILVASTHNGTPEEHFRIARAIWEMYTKGVYTTTMDHVFTKSLNDYANNLILKDDKDKKDLQHLLIEFSKKVDLDFLRNELLKDEYSKLREKYGVKNGAMDSAPVM